MVNPGREPLQVQQPAALDRAVFHNVGIKRMLDGNLASVLLAHQAADEGPRLLAESVAGDVVGDVEDNDGVKNGVQI